jgi:hypothetical protein
VFCLVVGLNTLYTSTMSIWSNVWSSSGVSLFTFYLHDSSISDNGEFRYLAISVLAFICALRAIRDF